jgi:hypothetical protein
MDVTLLVRFVLEPIPVIFVARDWFTLLSERRDPLREGADDLYLGPVSAIFFILADRDHKAGTRAVRGAEVEGLHSTSPYLEIAEKSQLSAKQIG